MWLQAFYSCIFSRAGGLGELNQGININFGTATTKEVEKKEMPSWISESTVKTAEVLPCRLAAPNLPVLQDRAEEAAVASMGPSMGLVEDDTGAQAEPDDEITNLLLRHERSQKAGPGAAELGDAVDSDSDNRSDDSDVEGGGLGDGMEREAAMLAATFAGNDRDETNDDVEMMDDDSGEDDDIPVVRVGGEEFDLTDVTPEIIARMSTEEMERYNQLYRDFYKDMYD
jgi:hypothetical protein